MELLGPPPPGCFSTDDFEWDNEPLAVPGNKANAAAAATTEEANQFISLVFAMLEKLVDELKQSEKQIEALESQISSEPTTDPTKKQSILNQLAATEKKEKDLEKSIQKLEAEAAKVNSPKAFSQFLQGLMSISNQIKAAEDEVTKIVDSTS